MIYCLPWSSVEAVVVSACSRGHPQVRAELLKGAAGSFAQLGGKRSDLAGIGDATRHDGRGAGHGGLFHIVSLQGIEPGFDGGARFRRANLFRS